MSDTANEGKLHWLVRPTTIRKLWWAGGIMLAAVTLADVGVKGSAAFGVDGTFAFYSWYGLATCTVMVVFAKIVGIGLKRKDTYYEPGDDSGKGDSDV